MSSRIQLRNIRFFIAAADLGSIRSAARAFDLDIGTVSRAIRDLEDDLGVSLFNRGTAGVSLTFAGERFLVRMRSVFHQIQEAVHDIVAIGQGQEGSVRIGLISSLASSFLSELVCEFRTKHSDVRLEFVDGRPDEHIRSVQQHRLDVAFLTGQPHAEGCDLAHLWNEDIFLVMSESDALAEQEEIQWADLYDRKFIVGCGQLGPEICNYLIKRLSALGYLPVVEQQSVHRDNLMQIVAKGNNLTLTSEGTVALRFPGIHYRPLRGETLPFLAVWSPKNDNPAFRRLLSSAKVLSKRCRENARKA
nr:LysR substrate-binding domain-containing protein [Brucella intermedia]